MNDQRDKWGAFCRLAERDPRTHALAHGNSIVAANIVLRHPDGSRYVRCGWYRDAIRAQDATVSPQALALRMERVGWRRRGKKGWIKATQPSGPVTHAWTFYVVAAAWEETVA
jgi:hypothetical protein